MSMDMNSLVKMAKNRSVENEKRSRTNYKENVDYAGTQFRAC